jgi:hypothetical protein
LPAAQTLTLQEMRHNFSNALQQRMNLPKAPVWRDITGKPPRTLCEPFQVHEALGEPGYTAFTSYGLIKISDSEWLLLTFTMTGQSSIERQAYQIAIDKIFASVKANPQKP